MNLNLIDLDSNHQVEANICKGKTIEISEQDGSSFPCLLDSLSYSGKDNIHTRNANVVTKQNLLGTNIRRSSSYETEATPCFGSRRKKCDSESSASDFLTCTNEKSFQDTINLLKKDYLKEAVGEYIERLVNESISNAIKEIDVGNLSAEIKRNLLGSATSKDEIIDSANHTEVRDDAILKSDNSNIVDHDDIRNSDTFSSSQGFDHDASADSDNSKKEIVLNKTSDSGSSLDSADVAIIAEPLLRNYEEGMTDDGIENTLHSKATINKESISTEDCSNMDSCIDESQIALNNASECEWSDKINLKTNFAKDRSQELSFTNVESIRNSQIKETLGESDGEIVNQIGGEIEIVDGNMKVVESKLASEVTSVDELNIESACNDDTEDLAGISTDEDTRNTEITPNGEESNSLLKKIFGEKKEQNSEDEKKINWKVGYLYVKLPHKSRSKGNLKVWKKRCVSIQPDEFAGDASNPSLVISVYSAESGSARKHSASFWRSVASRSASLFRSGSRTQRYAFTVYEKGVAVVNLAADCEALTQEWMAAFRNILWPPSPVVQLEKLLNGQEFEVSIIDNQFSLRAGLQGMYGYLAITPKKLILLHPQAGYVIQEWYLNTVDNFQLVHQTRIEDVHKVLAMSTCSDSSTGKGEILLFCREAVGLLQSLASTIHQVLAQRSMQEGGKYQRQLQDLAEWFSSAQEEQESYYKVPPKQVKSLLDIPNFIFNKPLSPTASLTCAPGDSMDKPPSGDALNMTRGSQDSGISAGTTSTDDYLNCNSASFVVGAITGTDSELSDACTPPLSPELHKRKTEDLRSDEALA